MNKEDYSRLLFFSDDNMIEEKESRDSTVKMLLVNARELSGRDLKTGKYESKDLKDDDYDFENNLHLSKRFSGLMQYLIFLELIGSVFQKKTIHSNENGIKRALDMFSDKILKEDFDAVAGLRHSLVHKFSLCTENKGINSFCYTLIWDKEDFIINKPKEDWNGEFSSKTENHLTEICVENLIDHIEEIYAKLFSELKNGNLSVTPEIEELKSRYTIKS